MRWLTDAAIANDPSLGQALCRLATGLDRLYRRTRPTAAGEAALAAEGLVPVDLWRGEPLDLADWAAAAAAVETLQAQATTVPDPLRQAYLEDTLVSLGAFVGWQAGEAGQFRERASRLLGLKIEPVPAERLAGWREELRTDLARMGFSCATVAEAVHTYEKTREVPRGELISVAQSALTDARLRVDHKIGALPPRPQMQVEVVHDVPYSAYCAYETNTMRLNGDQPFTPERLKLLVLHEAYPGHDYHLAWRESAVKAGHQPADSLLVITNTPSSPLFEGIGDNGPLFLDVLEDDVHLELAFRLGKLRSAACVNACLMLHEAGASPHRVQEFLVEEGCAQPTWAATRLRFMQDPLRAPFVFAYFLGFDSVAQASVDWPGDRPAFYQCLYGQMHSPRSLRLATELASRRRP